MKTDPRRVPRLAAPAAPVPARIVRATIVRLLSAATLAAAVGGCALVSPLDGPVERRLTDPAPAAWSRSQPAAQPGTPAGDAGLARWWTALSDPELDALIGEALAASPDLASARARLRQARASRDLAVAGWFPTIGATAGATRSSSSRAAGSDGKARTLYNAGFDASWEPDIFGAVGAGVDAAEADLEAQADALAATRVSLAAEVALNYVDLRGYQNRLAIARSNARSQTETLQITEWRNEAGLATRLDVEQARTNLEQTRATIPSLEVGEAEAEHRIAQLIGRAPGSLHGRLATAVTLPALPDRVAEGIPVDTLRRRPDVRAAERTLAAETARIRQQLAARLPSLALSGSFGWQSLTRSALGGGASLARSLAASLGATLFDGGRQRSRIEFQDAVAEQAFAAYQQAVLTALGDVENALVGYAAGRERTESRARAAESARAAAELARYQYQAGLADFQKVLDTERTLLTAEDNLAQARAQVLTAVIQLYKALGGGWDFPAAAVRPDSRPRPAEDRPS